MKTAILTISTSVAARPAEDRSGRGAGRARRAGRGRGRWPARWSPTTATRSRTRCGARSRPAPSLIFTTGGTGLTPDDVTPEATRAVIDRDAPGFAEAMRAESLEHTPMGILTRGVSGIAGRTLIVNFPGNPKAIGELFPVIAPTLEHVVGDAPARGRPWRPASTGPVPDTPAIELRGLTRHFGERTALADVSVHRPGGRDARRARPQRRRQVDAAADPGHAAAPARGRGGAVRRAAPAAGVRGPRPARAARPRAAALPRPERPREPRATTRGCTASTRRGSSELLEAVRHARPRRRAGPAAQPRDGPAGRRLPRRPAPARSCCCSTSRGRTSIPAPASCVEPLIGRAARGHPGAHQPRPAGGAGRGRPRARRSSDGRPPRSSAPPAAARPTPRLEELYA